MNTICFIDLEATCTKDKHDTNFVNEILEIGAVLVKYGKVVSRFSRIVQPSVSDITEYCTNLTGLTKESVNSSKSFRTVWGEFVKWLKCKSKGYSVTLAGFGEQDWIQIKKDCKLHGLKVLDVKYVNIKPLFERSLKLPRIGLDGVLRHLNMSFEGNRHRALDDAENLYKAYSKAFTK